jgi:hypothetical protein
MSMQTWLMQQFENFNVLTIIIMITFVTAMGKANLNKQLTKQSEEFYKEIEELKSEIWRAKGAKG